MGTVQAQEMDEIKNVDKTLRDVAQLRELVKQYISLKQEESDLAYKEVLRLDTASLDIRLPIGKSIIIDCNSDELARRLNQFYNMPCGEVVVEEVAFRENSGRMQITIYLQDNGAARKITIGLWPLYLVGLLHLHVFNEKINLLDMLNEAIVKEIQDEAKWVETLKEILAMVEIVLKH